LSGAAIGWSRVRRFSAAQAVHKNQFTKGEYVLAFGYYERTFWQAGGFLSGHPGRRWKPKMKEYIFGERNEFYLLIYRKTSGCSA